MLNRHVIPVFMAPLALLTVGACGPVDESDDGSPSVQMSEMTDPPVMNAVDCKAIRNDLFNFPANQTGTGVVNRALTYLAANFRPTSANLTTGRVVNGKTVKTSPSFVAGAYYSFPYRRGGYDTTAVFMACKDTIVSGTNKYLFGVWSPSNVDIWRGYGLLGLDCAGFIGKAYGAGDNDYTTPSMIYNKCPKVGITGKEIADYKLAKKGYVLRRYANPEPAGIPNHFMLVEVTPSSSATSLQVLEAGSVFNSKTDRVVRTTIPYTSLRSANFILCKPSGWVSE